MKRFFKIFCVILIVILLVSFIFSCSPNNLDIPNIVPGAPSESNTEGNVSEPTQDPNVNFNPFANVTMSCIGDSITMATKVDRPYPTAVKNLLGLKEVYNYGVSWSTVAYNEDCHCHPDSDYNHDPYVFRFSEIENADIIAVMGGTNDYSFIPLGTIEDTEPTTFYGALNILAEGLKADHPDSYIFFMTCFNYYSADSSNKNGDLWAEFNEAIVAVCEKHDIDCLDVYNELPIVRDVDMIDGVHPTQEFIEHKWAPMIAEFIRENYKK